MIASVEPKQSIAGMRAATSVVATQLILSPRIQALFDEDRAGLEAAQDWVDVLPSMICCSIGNISSSGYQLNIVWQLCLIAARVMDDVADNECRYATLKNLTPDEQGDLAESMLHSAQDILNQIFAGTPLAEDAKQLIGQVGTLGQLAQQEEAELAFRPKTYESYFAIALRKSANFYATICWLATLLQTKQQSQACQRAYDFGLAVGLCRQMKDDWCDIVIDTQRGIYTIPLIYALTLNEHPQHKALNDLVIEQDDTAMETCLEQMLIAMGADQHVLQRVALQQEQALLALDDFATCDTTLLVAYVRQ